MPSSNRSCLLAAILVFCATMRCTSAHTFFTSEIEGIDGNASFVGYTHMGNFYYNLTSDTLTDIASVKLVDGDTKGDFTTLVTLDKPVPSNSTAVLGEMEGMVPAPPAFSYFGPDNVNATALGPAIYGGVYDLFQLACKGKLLLSIETKTAQLSATVKYRPPVGDMDGPAKTCEEATQPYKAAAAPSPAAVPMPATSGSVQAVASVCAAVFATATAMVLMV